MYQVHCRYMTIQLYLPAPLYYNIIGDVGKADSESAACFRICKAIWLAIPCSLEQVVHIGRTA